MAEFSKSYKSGAFTLRVVWSENTISVGNNTSKVTVTAYLDMTSGASLSISAKNNTFTINGTDYAFTSSAITKSSGSARTVTLGSVTSSAISHGSDGSKSITIKCTFNIAATLGGTYYASFTASQSVSLTKIARLSSLSASNGTLGISQNLTVTQQNSAYTHTIAYTCGNASETIATKSSNLTIAFIPPLSLASQNTTGTSVSIEFTITTYNGNTSLGSSKKTITCSIPSSVKPEVSMSITDPTGYLSTYGTAIKGKSTLQITLSVTLGGSSPINSYLITANGETYTTASAVTSVLKTSGTMTVTAKVTDKRGRIDTATTDIQILDYNAPSITSLSVRRCNQNGTENDQGAYIKVTFSGSVTSLNNNNTAKWSIQYKPTSTQVYSTVSLSTLNDHYSVTNHEYIFAADTGKSYDVRVYVKDDFEELYRTTAASTALTIMNFKTNGKGMAVGKISEIDNVFDMGFKARFFAGIQPIILTDNYGTNLNDITKSGFYASTVIQTSYLNCPPNLVNISFFLEVYDGGNSGQLCQKLTTTSGTNCYVYQRFYYNQSGTFQWFPWKKIYQQNPVTLWEGDKILGYDSNNNIDYVELSETINSQINGIVLVFKLTDTISHYQNFFISKNFISNYFYTFEMVSYTFRYKAMKLLKISDNVTNNNGETIAKITGDSNNTTSGTGNSNIGYDNSKMSLVKVLGW